MSNIFNKALAAVFGTKSQRDLKVLYPYVEKINNEWVKISGSSFSDDDLRAKTKEIQQIISTELEEIDTKIENLRQEVENTPDMNIHVKEDIFNQIDKLEEERNKELEVVLMNVLPQAFAVVKETARRLKENGKLVVNASDFDKAISEKKANVTISDGKATWHNKWLAAGNEVTWDMVHYDVQLIGGIVLHEGKISEMATGEGKTLVATLPAFLNALAKRGVHIVTVNDYLAKRDSEWMAPIFELHELTVDRNDKHDPHSFQRKQAYMADIIYGTNNEFGFDYLRDNMAMETTDMVQRRHHYAMVDEVDSVLIDDARTPLIIAGPVPRGDEHEYYELKPRISRLVEAQKKYTQELLNEAKKKIGTSEEKEGALCLFRAYRGLPKYKPLIKFLGEEGMKVLLQKTENIYLTDNSKLMPEADKVLYFTIDEKNNQIDLTEKGIDFITGAGEDTTFFILPDIGTEIATLEGDNSLTEQEKAEKKDLLISDYGIKAQRIHSVSQLLKAYTLFEKEVEYILVDGKVKIVDEQTGRIMEGRRYSDGLHQALEAKENVKVEDATQTYATITLQNYFRMYHKLAGMTGTAETEAGEFWEIYKLDVVTIPTNIPATRKDQNDYVFKTMREKFNAVADEIVRLTEQGRPVLVGTTSVEISELLSRMLNIRKIKHQVLNAKLHQKEAEIVAEAGKSGTVTIATNMAGRGTDIKLSPESKAAGGLAIIGTERHESRRVDRQLRGRAGRQGDPGTSQFYVSLEDNLMRLFGSDRIAKFMDRLGLKEGEVIQHSMITGSIERAQKKVEENNFGSRKRLLEYDDVMNSQRSIVYKRRKNALYGERLELDIINILYDTCDDVITNYQGVGNYENFRLHVISMLNFDPEILEEEFEKGNPQTLVDKLFAQAEKHYAEKNQKIAQKAFPILKDISQERGQNITEVVVPFTDGKRQLNVLTPLQKTIDTQGRELMRSMEKIISLSIIDQGWKEHLREMDDLKQSVQMAVHEQKDPLMIYKFEGFELFKRFVAQINQEMVSFLMRAELPIVERDQLREKQNTGRTKQQKLQENKAEAKSILGNTGGQQMQNEEEKVIEKQTPIKSQKIANRNDKVSVKYNDGRIVKDVKYKSIEQDLKNNKCVLIEG